MSQLKNAFDEKWFVGKKGKKIEIGRADVQDMGDTLMEAGLPIDVSPAIFVMHEGRYFRYKFNDVREEDGTYESIAGIVHFINRLQHPYLKLESEEAIEAFLD